MVRHVQISSGVMTRIDSTVNCRGCGVRINVERLFVAKAIVETPELLTFLPDSERLHISTLEQAQAVAEILDVTNPTVPVITCESCGGNNSLAVSRYCHTMDVPPFLWCRCSQEVDLRYPADRDRVRFMARFPYLPFLICRSCRKRMLIPPFGKDSWRMPVFRVVNLFREMY